MIAKANAHQRQHEARFGKVREPIHVNFSGQKIVAVGNRIVFAPEAEMRTFVDFLIKYIGGTLGKEWGNREIRGKPLEERHPILQWWDALCRQRRAAVPGADGLVTIPPDALSMAYLQLAYDLYILRHHGALQRRLIDRLKVGDSFQGARHELFATAVCIRSGCTIDYEDDKDGTRTHAEFIATHRETGARFALEAKSRRRAGILGFRGEPDRSLKPKADVRRLLSQAIVKEVTTPLVILLDLNLPCPADGDDRYWGPEILQTVDAVCPRPAPDPFNLLVVTNYPAHYCKQGDPIPRLQSLNLLSQLPARSHNSSVLIEVSSQVGKWGEIPTEFPKDWRD